VKDLTQRETEILALLKNDPMISQKDLADQLKISRSAVAVHISNLIKKGAVLGRGYVLNERFGIVVCGLLYINTVGYAYDNGQGQVKEAIGGIGLSVKTYLFAMLPDLH